ncbi:MAG: formate dehydrogenase accessory sulfurtransferase FdhD [Alphaproteobacteria bacterium]|nr:formate dehydrogenase accessory sulfurtransferase FdhD [Alphaproteobacteria bacterium]
MAGAATRDKSGEAAGRGSVPVTVLVREPDMPAARRQWQLAEEVAVNLAYNGHPHVVMMATPRDLEDFAVGFSLSEGVLASSGLIKSVEVEEVEGGIKINVLTVPKAEVSRDRQARSLEGRTGCGICGMQRLEQVVRNVRPVRPGFAVDADAIARAFAALPGRQVLNQENKSLHGAAWCTRDGEIVLIREDVGRHTALDKLIGAMAAADIEPAEGFVVMTSRCSFELVQKASSVGIPCLATVSAPTSLALDLAGRAGMVLASLAQDGVVLFESPEPAKDES